MYKTSDLYLAAFLKAKEHKLTCERSSRKCFFVFGSDVSKDVADFFNDGLISATKYKNAVQDIKTYIFNTGA